jgi:hypothetical protein
MIFGQAAGKDAISRLKLPNAMTLQCRTVACESLSQSRHAGSSEIDFAKSAHVNQSQASARNGDLSLVIRVRRRYEPAVSLDHAGTLCHMPVMERGSRQWLA